MFVNIPGFPKYQISPKGEIFSHISSRILKGSVCKYTGYLKVSLIDAQGRRQNTLFHLLMASAFIPNPNNLPEINHKDGDKLNNQLTNLEWVSGRDNVRHAFTNNLCCWKASIDYEKIPEIILKLQTNKSWSDLQQDYGTSDPSVLRKLIKREFVRQGKLSEFNQLCTLVRERLIDQRSQKIELIAPSGGCTMFPSVNAVARFLGVNPGTVHKALTHNKPVASYQIRRLP